MSTDINGRPSAFLLSVFSGAWVGFACGLFAALINAWLNNHVAHGHFWLLFSETRKTILGSIAIIVSFTLLLYGTTRLRSSDSLLPFPRIVFFSSIPSALLAVTFYMQEIKFFLKGTVFWEAVKDTVPPGLPRSALTLFTASLVAITAAALTYGILRIVIPKQPSVLTIKRHISVFFVAMILLVTSPYLFQLSPRQDLPNIVLVSIDSLREDHLGYYGYSNATSPNIDAFASQSLVFTNHTATSSWTLPTHMSMLTGLYPSTHKVIDGRYRLSRKFITLAEVAKNQRYTTAGFISGPLLKAKFGYAQGFDIYDDHCSSSTHIKSHRDITNTALTKAVTNWLTQNLHRRFFLFVHFWDVHYDYIPPKSYEVFDPTYRGDIDPLDFESNEKIHADMNPHDLNHIISLYDGEILWTDHHFGRILDCLEELNLTEKTIVVLTSDHGEEFFEHGKKGHTKNLYETVLDTPLILHIPSGPIGESTALASHVDIMPTLVLFMKSPVPQELDGIDLLDHELDTDDRLVYSELFDHQFAARWDYHKCIYCAETGNVELFNLATDPHELRNLAHTSESHNSVTLDEVSATQVSLLVEFTRAYAADKVSDDHRNAESILDEETEEQLRALGYLK